MMLSPKKTALLMCGQSGEYGRSISYLVSDLIMSSDGEIDALGSEAFAKVMTAYLPSFSTSICVRSVQLAKTHV